MKRTIYVVVGTTGEYSDRSEWLVCAFVKEQDAKDLVVNASRRAQELAATRSSQYSIERAANEYDPKMEMDYTGTTYYYAPVELRK